MVICLRVHINTFLQKKLEEAAEVGDILFLKEQPVFLLFLRFVGIINEKNRFLQEEHKRRVVLAAKAKVVAFKGDCTKFKENTGFLIALRPERKLHNAVSFSVFR